MRWRGNQTFAGDQPPVNPNSVPVTFASGTVRPELLERLFAREKIAKKGWGTAPKKEIPEENRVNERSNEAPLPKERLIPARDDRMSNQFPE
jgi:hypothetical protein